MAMYKVFFLFYWVYPEVAGGALVHTEALVLPGFRECQI